MDAGEDLSASSSGERSINLLHDVTQHSRRALALRLGALILLVVSVLAAGWWVRSRGSDRARAEALRAAEARLQGGSLAELREAADTLARAGASTAGDADLDRAALVIDALVAYTKFK